MVGVPIGNDIFAVNSALEIVRDGGVEQLARILRRMPDKRSANLIATSSMVQRIYYIERVMQCGCSSTDESSFFEDGFPVNRLTLQPHQKSQASLSTGAGGVGLLLAESRRMSASIESLVATVPKVLAYLSGPLGEYVRR